jgi:signal transduction histidine kinase
VRQERYQYIKELTAQINDYNDLLTEWIQMRQGQLSLRIESFPLQPLFDIISRNSTSYQMKGIALQVVHTDAVIKADRILTLFMISTLADNARKFTPEGGQVTVSATAHEQYVEVSVEDTGVGMTAEQCEHLFDYKPVHDTSAKDVTSHGFGLVNCKGIIEKYKKVSKLFSNCTIAVESDVGKGSRLFFRLPKGITKTARAFLLLLSRARWR